MVTDHTISFESLANVEGVRIVGQVGIGKIISMVESGDKGYPDVVVISWQGYSENPGSRYSGLKSYYPAHTEVFGFDHVDGFGRCQYRSLIEWENSKPYWKRIEPDYSGSVRTMRRHVEIVKAMADRENQAVKI